MATDVSEEEVRLRTVFVKFDKDKSGVIDSAELLTVLGAMGKSEEEAKRVAGGILAKYDKDSDMKVTLPEILSGLEASRREATMSEEELRLRTVFEKFDKDNSGVIDSAELLTVLGAMGKSEEEAKRVAGGILVKYDKDKDLKVTLEEILSGLKA